LTNSEREVANPTYESARSTSRERSITYNSHKLKKLEKQAQLVLTYSGQKSTQYKLESKRQSIDSADNDEYAITSAV